MSAAKIPLDQTYHYPPELLEMLIDAIPCLFKSKQGVIDFFHGAGTPAPFLTKWRSKVKTDRDSFTKYDIVRDILRRLNEGGDKTLAQRREVLKRVSEFEDFSTCWERDRYKAQGLVAQIRQLINIKDSFTRLNLERERERKINQAQYQAAVQEKQKRTTERVALRDTFYKLFTENDAHKRGKALESALNDLFKNCGILIKEAFTYIGPNSEGVLEQVDGAVEIGNHLYLVEMKWWAAPLGRADVSPHLVKLFSRADARGIIISSSDFTGPAIETVREAISLKTCVLCELKEIVFALENDIDLGELFRRKVDAAVTYKQPFHRIDTV